MTSPVNVLAFVRLKPLVVPDRLLIESGVVVAAGELTTPLNAMREFCALFDRKLLTPSRIGMLVVRPLLSGSE